MRTRVSTTLLALGLTGALAPVASAAHFPPANAGCGDNGLTQSQHRPTVTLTSATLRLRYTGHARIFLRGNQTAAMTVKIAQVGGKRVGGTPAGGYTCAIPEAGTVAVPISAYGRKLVRRHGRLAVKMTFRLINGSGVKHIRVWSAVIKLG
jgi:hypothetical protein